MNEFDMIARYFEPLTKGQEGCARLQDDAAVISVPQGYELVVTSDTLNEDVHFLAEESPKIIAKKALRVNLSDLASMGAKPLCYQLNLAFPGKPDEAWLAAFSQSLEEENALYDVYCSGGDTTTIHGAHLSISITALGLVPAGKALRRTKAQDGDHLVIANYTGLAALGLKVLQNKLDEDLYPIAVKSYKTPHVHTDLADICQDYVRAAADISDGLLADSLHIAQASGLGVEIDTDKIIFHDEIALALRSHVLNIEAAIKGGDDYVLAMAVAPENVDNLCNVLKEKGAQPQDIGVFRKEIEGLVLKGEHTDVHTDHLGWLHF